MRFTWIRKKTSPQAAVDRMHFVMWDFLKMLTLAALCGLGISIAASVIVVLLSTPAEARQPGKSVASSQQRDDLPYLPTPGSLRVGDGCDGDELAAIERDWLVHVSPGKVEVRVMQTFQLPAVDPIVAAFHMQLLQGAVLQSLTAQAEDFQWPGKLLSAHEHSALSPAHYRQLTRRHVIAVADARGKVTTSPLIDLRGNETLVIQYTYVLTGEDAQTLALPLEAENDSPADRPIETPTQNNWSVPPRLSASASVWVEWSDALPARLAAPAGTVIDWSQKRIQGASWSATALAPGARFVASWSM